MKPQANQNGRRNIGDEMLPHAKFLTLSFDGVTFILILVGLLIKTMYDLMNYDEVLDIDNFWKWQNATLGSTMCDGITHLKCFEIVWIQATGSGRWLILVSATLWMWVAMYFSLKYKWILGLVIWCFVHGTIVVVVAELFAASIFYNNGIFHPVLCLIFFGIIWWRCYLIFVVMFAVKELIKNKLKASKRKSGAGPAGGDGDDDDEEDGLEMKFLGGDASGGGGGAKTGGEAT